MISRGLWPSATATVLLAGVLAGCAGSGRTFPDGPILPGGPMARAQAAPLPAAVPDTLVGQFAVYDGQGRSVDPQSLSAAFADADVVFLGELHDDPIAHALEHWLLQQALSERRQVALGMEMFERDVQLVIDEFLSGTIRERDFLAAARPWSEYLRFYRPLVELARERGVPVLATNAPGRYVNLVARRGAAVLEMTATAHDFLPELPVAPASPALAEKFAAMMARMPAHQAPAGTEMPTTEGLLAAQNLRDATMADTVARWLAAHSGGLVVHANGVFHSEGGLGIPEHLRLYRPRARTVVISFRRVDDPTRPPAPSPGDDFVVQTRGSGE